MCSENTRGMLTHWLVVRRYFYRESCNIRYRVSNTETPFEKNVANSQNPDTLLAFIARNTTPLHFLVQERGKVELGRKHATRQNLLVKNQFKSTCKTDHFVADKVWTCTPYLHTSRRKSPPWLHCDKCKAVSAYGKSCLEMSTHNPALTDRIFPENPSVISIACIKHRGYFDP